MSWHWSLVGFGQPWAAAGNKRQGEGWPASQQHRQPWNPLWHHSSEELPGHMVATGHTQWLLWMDTHFSYGFDFPTIGVLLETLFLCLKESFIAILHYFWPLYVKESVTWAPNHAIHWFLTRSLLWSECQSPLPPKFVCWNYNPQVMALGSGAFGK